MRRRRRTDCGERRESVLWSLWRCEMKKISHGEAAERPRAKD
jgi:hypothetical protein